MSDNRPLEVADLIFSSASDEIRSFVKESRRSALSISNRLKSIHTDATFVRAVAERYDLPLVANERCGSWYIEPSKKTQSAYFKSTDGHAGQWKFSLRRLNLQVLEIVIEHGGCVIVDSTRRGKSMPDALSKTIPIWIAVLNRFFFPNDTEAARLRTSESLVPASEHSQIELRLDDFVEQLKALELDHSALHKTLTKPLCPIWMTPSSPFPDLPPSHFLPVVLCTASRLVPGGEDSANGYIQGAADDSESWAHGLSPALFWTHSESLLSSSEDELPALISSLISRSVGSDDHDERSLAWERAISPATSLSIGNLYAARRSDCEIVIICSPTAVLEGHGEPTRTTLNLPLETGKVGSRQLRHHLSSVMELLDSSFNTQRSLSAGPVRILVGCETGKDHSVGVALAILCLYANDDGVLVPREKHTNRAMSKNFIKQRLSWIMVSMPAANPSRTTLQSVNAFLLG